LQVKFAENRAKCEQRNAKFKLAIEKRDLKIAKEKLLYSDRSTFCQVLLEQKVKKNETKNSSVQHVKGTRRNGRCLDGSLDMTLTENKNKRKHID